MPAWQNYFHFQGPGTVHSMPLFYPVHQRRFFYIIIDIGLIVLSYLAAYGIRFFPELNTSPEFLSWPHFAVLTISYFLSFYFFRVYNTIWVYSNIHDIYRMILGNITGFVISIIVMVLLDIKISRMIVILSFLSIGIGSIFYRVLIRDVFSRVRTRITPDELMSRLKEGAPGKMEKNILIIGAGEGGRGLLSEYRRRGLDKSIIGFIDDDPFKIGKILNGKMVFADTFNCGDVIEKYDIDEVIIAMPSADSVQVQRIVSIIRRTQPFIQVKILPYQAELLDQKPLMPALRDISISDLIGREEFSIDSSKIIERLSGKTVLVTGAGGSIGSEICRQLLKFKVKKLIAIGRGEFSIYNLVKIINDDIEFVDDRPEVIYRIINVKDEQLLKKTFNVFRPDIVFHAAAHKHVPLMEFNEIEALQNNVIGTRNVLEASLQSGVSEFIMISTDKAVNPVNIMGASKRLAELVVEYYHREKGLKASIVRFGNVLGSRGSALPLFREQIEKGGPVTITDPEVTRYFMSIPEASLLVINAAAYSSGGEIFVLDMGKQYRVIDIARRLIELHGYVPDRDINIEITGLRPGEKMYEELFYGKEMLIKTGNEKIYVLNTGGIELSIHKINTFLEKQSKNLIELSPHEIRDLIKNIVPEYDYQEQKESNGSRLVN